MARERPEEFAAYIGSKQSAEIQREIRRQEKELAAMRKQKAELDAIFKKLYEDSVLGRITTEQFQMLSGSYTEEQSRITAGIPQKESEIQCLRETVSGTDSLCSMEIVSCSKSIACHRSPRTSLRRRP